MAASMLQDRAQQYCCCAGCLVSVGCCKGIASCMQGITSTATAGTWLVYYNMMLLPLKRQSLVYKIILYPCTALLHLTVLLYCAWLHLTVLFAAPSCTAVLLYTAAA